MRLAHSALGWAMLLLGSASGAQGIAATAASGATLPSPDPRWAELPTPPMSRRQLDSLVNPATMPFTLDYKPNIELPLKQQYERDVCPSGEYIGPIPGRKRYTLDTWWWAVTPAYAARTCWPKEHIVPDLADARAVGVRLEDSAQQLCTQRNGSEHCQPAKRFWRVELTLDTGRFPMSHVVNYYTPADANSEIMLAFSPAELAWRQQRLRSGTVPGVVPPVGPEALYWQMAGQALPKGSVQLDGYYKHVMVGMDTASFKLDLGPIAAAPKAGELMLRVQKLPGTTSSGGDLVVRIPEALVQKMRATELALPPPAPLSLPAIPAHCPGGQYLGPEAGHSTYVKNHWLWVVSPRFAKRYCFPNSMVVPDLAVEAISVRMEHNPDDIVCRVTPGQPDCRPTWRQWVLEMRTGPGMFSNIQIPTREFFRIAPRRGVLFASSWDELLWRFQKINLKENMNSGNTPAMYRDAVALVAYKEGKVIWPMSSMADTYYFKEGWSKLDVVGMEMNIGAVTNTKVDAMNPDGYAIVIKQPEMLRNSLRGVSMQSFQAVIPLPAPLLNGLKATDEGLFNGLLNKFKRGESM